MFLSQKQEVIDYSSWIYNLTLANLTPQKEPNWFKAYSFKDEFNVSDLSPASLIDLVYNFINDQNLATKYWQQKMKQGDPKLRRGCNEHCLRSHICAIVKNDFHKFDICNPKQKREKGHGHGNELK